MVKFGTSEEKRNFLERLDLSASFVLSSKVLKLEGYYHKTGQDNNLRYIIK